MRSKLAWLVAMLTAWLMCAATPAAAANCAGATSAGSAPNGWDTYCWLDLTTYNDATALSAGGQAMSFSLSDGSVFSMNIKATSTKAMAITAVAAPAWTGGAVGNTAFLGIPGKPIAYTTNDGATVVLTISNMKITPPAGALAGNFMFIVADGESTNTPEQLNYVTNGGNWQLLDLVPPISGNTYPPYTLSGQTANVMGANGTVGGEIFGTVSPTTVTTTLTAGGLQGVMFAVRFASVRVNTSIVTGRLAAADQFTHSVKSTSSGGTLATATSTGASNGPFANAAAPLASGISITLNEAIAAGSASTLAQYQSKLSCTNSNQGSATVMPTNVVTTNFVLGSVQFGDAINCTFFEYPQPRLSLAKALSNGRAFANDQFTISVANGATVVATTTTTGTGSTVTTGTTGVLQVTAGTSYTLKEAAAGGTNFALYAADLVCSNASSVSATTMPTTVGGSVAPTWGDNITCTITNTANATKAILEIIKVSTLVSDPINGTVNPKAIPGAIVQYTITVTNTGPGAVDAGTLVLADPLPGAIIASVAGTPITFTDGATASGLSYTYAAGSTWTKAAGGGAPYTYTPVPDASGFDSAVTGFRIAPTGSMKGATVNAQPSFTISYTAKIR